MPRTLTLLKSEGAGKAGCPLAPVGPRAKNSRKGAKSTGCGGEHSGLPCAMVLRLIRALLGEPMLDCHHRLREAFRLRSDLTPASGRRDHTISPSASAPLVSQHIRSHRIPAPRL